MRSLLCCTLVVVAACSSSATRQHVAPGAIPAHKLTTPDAQPLIPRHTLFGPADHADVAVSPDGTTIAWLGIENSVPNIFLAAVNDPSAPKALTHLTGGGGVLGFTYARDDQRIIYSIDPSGEGHHHVVVLDIAAGASRDATPFPAARSSVIAVSDAKRASVLIVSNKRDAKADDVYELDLAKLTLKLVYENNEGLTHFAANDDWRVLVAERLTDKGKELVVIDVAKKKVKTLVTYSANEASTSRHVSVSADGKFVYTTSCKGRATAGLYEIDTATGKQRLVADDARVDVSEVVFHPVTRAPRLAYFEYDTVASVVSDSAIAHELYALKSIRDGRITWVANRDDSVWLVSIADSKSPTRFYLYERASHEPQYLFSSRDALAETNLPERRTAMFTARDGTSRLAYVTLPSSATDDDLPWVDHAMPLVVDVGAATRAGYDARAAWLANRGYVVLQMERHSATDVDDAIAWAVRKGIADSEKVAVYGETELEPGTKVVTVPAARDDMFPAESFLAENLGGRVEPASVVAK